MICHIIRYCIYQERMKFDMIFTFIYVNTELINKRKSVNALSLNLNIIVTIRDITFEKSQ